MFNIFKILFLSSFLFLTGCETANTLVAPQGNKTTELLASKDNQILTLNNQVKDLKNLNEQQQLEAAKAASSIKGILKANEYVEPALPKEAIQAEGEVAQKRLPNDDPAETVRALERVMLIITGQRDEARQKYSEVLNEISLVRKQIKEKEDIIAKRDEEITKRDAEIAKLKIESEKEQENAKINLQNKINQKDKEIKDLIQKYEEKEKSWWTNGARIAGISLIVIGALLLAVLKMVLEGGGLILAGVIIGLVSIFLDWLTHQPWFYYATGGVLLIVFVCIGYGLYRAWKIKTLHTKVTAAWQDLRDEAEIIKNDAWEKASEHLKYRLGDRNSFWGKAQMEELAKSGLINPKATSETDKVDNTKV